MKKTFLVVLLFMLMPLLSAVAATIDVPGDQPTIQAGIDASVDGDIVLLADGTYTGVGNYNIDFSGKSITVKSTGGADVCIVDCQGLGRGILIYNGETVTLEGLTVTNGDAGGNHGGGIYANGSDIIVVGCIFDSNSARDGSAVYSYVASSFFTNCTFISNNSAADGGAVFSAVSSFTNCTFTSNNSARNGGAVYSYNPSLFTNCTFISNNSAADGGAIYSSSYQTAISSTFFTNCTFASNSAHSGGAVYFSYYASSFFTSCAFTSNSALYGGALYSSGDANVYSFTNCTFASNSAYSGGAVYSYYYSNGFFTNCTFTLNNATQQGGAIWCDPGLPLTLKNCILWGDIALDGSEIYEKEEPLFITYSEIQGGHTGDGNIDADPLFVHADNDLHLQLTSPCIDTGIADGAPSDDLDGYLRPIGAGYDMGAYEYHYDTLFWQGDSNDWDDSQNWQPSMVPIVFNAVVISGLPSERDWPVVDDLNSVAEKVTIESGTLMIDQGRLTIGGS